MTQERFITVAIHTYDKAIALRSLLEREGVEVQFRNVNIEQPIVSSGIRVRIREKDLPLALRIIENRDIFSEPIVPVRQGNPAMPVLVPVDFSDNSLLATATAFKIAASHGSRIQLLHTYIDPYIVGSMQLSDSLTYELADAGARDKIASASEAQMRHFATRIRDKIKNGELPPVKFETHVMEGVPEDAINDYTKSSNPFLIVMGTRNAKRKELDLIGSVTAEVLDKCRFPVLALPEPPADHNPEFEVKSVLFFSNIEQEDILAIDALYRIFPKAHAKVSIVSVAGKKSKFLRSTAQASAALREYCTLNFKNYTFVTDTIDLAHLDEEFHRLNETERFDMIVVPNKKKNVFSRFFNPSLPHKVLFTSDIPTLVIPV